MNKQGWRLEIGEVLDSQFSWSLWRVKRI
jgi:hypothetical protein